MENLASHRDRRDAGYPFSGSDSDHRQAGMPLAGAPERHHAAYPATALFSAARVLTWFLSASGQDVRGFEQMDQ